jgi:hypothetical protein
VHHHHQFPNFPISTPVYAVPYYVPVPVEVPVDDTMEQMQPEPQPQYLGGPTIFDRRGPGTPVRDNTEERAPRKEPVEEPETTSTVAKVEPVAAVDQPETLLVFKDGHKLPVQNYAIIGDTLYDMTPGHSRRVALADLDIDTTVKENDARGIDFRLPLRPKAN